MDELEGMPWRLAHHAHPLACAHADRHYSRKTPGSPQMMPPGRHVVLLAGGLEDGAVWGVSWPNPAYTHAWPNAWLCTIFRREPGCPHRASDLIARAMAATRWCLVGLGQPPPNGLVTWVNPKNVRPTMVRGRPVYGWVFRKAGFVEEAPTPGGLVTLRLPVERLPAPEAPQGGQLALPALWPLESEAAG